MKQSDARSMAIAYLPDGFVSILRTYPFTMLTAADGTDIHGTLMNALEFEVIETRHFITLTERGSNREFRIPVSDAIVVGGLGTDWRTGDVVKLSEKQQKTLAELDARCREMGDQAAVRQNKLQNKLGCLSWIVVLTAIALIVWWIVKSRH